MTTANQAIRQDAHFNRYGLHLDTMEAELVRLGSIQMARMNMDQGRDLLSRGEREVAIMYLDRAEWALNA